MRSVEARRPTCAALVALAAMLVPPPPARAASVATDYVLPVWQGTSTSSAGPGHQIDCSSTNPYWPGGCTISNGTVTNGYNCALEAISTPARGVGGSNVYRDTPCVLRLDGYATWTEVAGQSCVFSPGMFVDSWQSGVNSTVFQSNGYPLTASMAPLTTAGGQLVANTYALTVKGDGTYRIHGHSIRMNERFLVKFNRSTLSCPGDDVTNARGNIYDAAADLSLSGRDGYFEDTVAV